MQAQTSHKNIGLMIFVFACALMLFAGITSANAQAPWGNNGGWNNNQTNGRYGRVSDKDIRKAYDKGFKQGLNDGKNDARNNRGTYRNGSYNNGGIMNRGGAGQLQRAYNDGYQRGYQEGYDRNRRNNRRYGNNGNIFGFPWPH